MYLSSTLFLLLLLALAVSGGYAVDVDPEEIASDLQTKWGSLISSILIGVLAQLPDNIDLSTTLRDVVSVLRYETLVGISYGNLRQFLGQEFSEISKGSLALDTVKSLSAQFMPLIKKTVGWLELRRIKGAYPILKRNVLRRTAGRLYSVRKRFDAQGRTPSSQQEAERILCGERSMFHVMGFLELTMPKCVRDWIFAYVGKFTRIWPCNMCSYHLLSVVRTGIFAIDHLEPLSKIDMLLNNDVLIPALCKYSNCQFIDDGVNSREKGSTGLIAVYFDAHKNELCLVPGNDTLQFCQSRHAYSVFEGSALARLRNDRAGCIRDAQTKRALTISRRLSNAGPIGIDRRSSTVVVGDMEWSGGHIISFCFVEVDHPGVSISREYIQRILLAQSTSILRLIYVLSLLRTGHIKQDDDFSLSEFHLEHNFDVSSLQDDPSRSARDLVDWLTQVGEEHGVIIVFEHEDAFRLLEFIEEFLPGHDISGTVLGFSAPSSIFFNDSLWTNLCVKMPSSRAEGGTGYGLESVCNALPNLSFDAKKAHNAEYDADMTRAALCEFAGEGNFYDSEVFSLIGKLSRELEDCLWTGDGAFGTSCLSLLPLHYLAGSMHICDQMYEKSIVGEFRKRIAAERRLFDASGDSASIPSDQTLALSQGGDDSGSVCFSSVNVCLRREAIRNEELSRENELLRSQLAKMTSQRDSCREGFIESRQSSQKLKAVCWELRHEIVRRDSEISALKRNLSHDAGGGDSKKRRSVSPFPF